jgi:hypothetical protein
MADTPEEALAYLDRFVPGTLPDKWDQQKTRL